MKYVVVYEKSATGWDAYVPDLPAVIATGATKKETRRLIREAIELHLDALRKITYRFPSRAHQQKWSPFHKPAWDSRGATADSAKQFSSVTKTPRTATPKTALAGNQVLEVDVLLAIYVASVLELVRFRAVTADHPWSICQRVVGSNIAAIDGKPQSPRIYTEQSGSVGSAAGLSRRTNA